MGSVAIDMGSSVFTGDSTGAMFGLTAIASLAGGTASHLAGGKFPNGAVTAAFAHMWNNEFHYKFFGGKKQNFITLNSGKNLRILGSRGKLP